MFNVAINFPCHTSVFKCKSCLRVVSILDGVHLHYCNVALISIGVHTSDIKLILL